MATPDEQFLLGIVSFVITEHAAASEILERAAAAGLTPEFGCRMGVCHKCTTRKKHGAVRNAISGEIRADTDEEITICNNVPVGDVCLDL